MSRVRPLLMYKLRFFFGPTLRGRFGAMPYIALTLLLLLYGGLFGFGLAQGLVNTPRAQAIGLISAPLALFLALGFIYSLGSGVTAHASEFDFLMTAPVRPREYLVADLIFQLVSLLAAGGGAGIVAALGIVWGLGRPLLVTLPFFAVFLGFIVLVLLTIQCLVVLNARYPKAHVRAATAVLFVLSLVPAISLAVPTFPLRFADLPVPPATFGTLGYEVLLGLPVDPGTVALAALEFAALAALWAAVSGTYIFHEIKPSLSAGFGQVDMIARMNQQRRMIGFLGRVTTRISVRADRGGDTSYMTRLHLIRIVRDGSVLFVLLFAIISVFSVNAGGPESQTATALGLAELMTLVPATLAINWSYYERENLWVALQGVKSASSYFRGLFLALTAVVLVVLAAFLTAYLAFTGIPASVEALSVPVAASVASALMAVALATRVHIKPAAFSPGMLATFVGVIGGGFLLGIVGEGLVVAGRVAFALGDALQAVVLTGYVVLLVAAGLWIVGRLAASFRL